MAPGELVTVSFWGLFVLACLIGLSFDLWRWWDERGWRRVEARAAERLIALRAKYERSPPASERATEGGCMWSIGMLCQLREIERLPTIEPQRWAS